MGDRPKSVKALTRGLGLLAAINDLSPATVTRLVEETGYPKATVIRLLQTLCREGYAEEIDKGRGYRVSYKATSLSRALSTKGPYQLAAEQELRALGTRLKWPCELLVRDGFSMVIETNNRKTAPIRMQLFERRRFPMLESASGIAYLSVLEREVATDLVERAVEQLGVSEPLEKPARDILERVSQGRRKGYVLRDYELLSPGMRVVAVPFSVGSVPMGALSLPHYRMFMHASVLDTEVLPALRHAAEQIGTNLEGDDRLLGIHAR